MVCNPHHLLALSLFISTGGSIASAGGWQLIDDFESQRPDERVVESPQWMRGDGAESPTVVRLEDGNQVAQIEPGQALVTVGGPDGVAIPEGGVALVYLKFRTLHSSRYWGGVFGMSRDSNPAPETVDAAWLLGRPSDGPRPNATFFAPSKDDDFVFLKNRGRMNRAYENHPEIKPEVWHTLWVTIDNSRDEMRFYIQGGDFESRTELTHYRDGAERFAPFQRPGALELRHFIVGCPTDAEGASPRTIQVDDINFMLQAPTSAIAGAP